MSTAVKSREQHLRETLAAKSVEVEGIASEFKDETGNGQYVISDEQQAKYIKSVGEMGEIKALLDAEMQATGIKSFLAAPAGDSRAAADAAEQKSYLATPEIKSLADLYIGSDVYKGMADSNFQRLGDQFGVKSSLHSLATASEVKDLYSASGGAISIPGFGGIQNLGLQPRKMRPGRVRDLFPQGTTTAALLYGMREMGFVNNARVVAERTAANGGPATGANTDVYGLKPMSQIDVQPVTYNIATIAHLMTAHRNVLADEPRLRALLDADMIDGVKMAEDFEILYGDGVGDNLTGIVNTPGVQQYAGLETDKKSAQVRRAMTRAILAFYAPSGIVMHPLDWEDCELETDRNGAYTIAVSVALGGEKRMWRLPVVDTPAHQVGGFLLGAFGQGAKIWDREEVNVIISTEDSDNIRRNAITMRAEERLGMEVPRPESMVVGTFAEYDPAA